MRKDLINNLKGMLSGMKKILTLCLTLFLLAFLIACGKISDITVPTDTAEIAEPTAAEQTPQTQTSDPSILPDTYSTPEASDVEAGEYRNVVTVSTIEELANAIANDTRIILNAGTYNFSRLDGATVNNAGIEVAEFGGIYGFAITGVSNLCIEAEDGAQVTVVTEYAHDPVLEFEYCSNIKLSGLTCGHDVEPGFCSGSVISVYRTKNFVIDDCKLYGSGTYGLDTDQSDKISLQNTEIYECTNGILLLNDTWSAEIKNCSFYNNSGYSLFSLNNSYDILFEDTEIYDNEITSYESEPTAIICNYSDSIIFRSCSFRDNSIEPIPENLPDVLFDNCIISENP